MMRGKKVPSGLLVDIDMVTGATLRFEIRVKITKWNNLLKQRRKLARRGMEQSPQEPHYAIAVATSKKCAKLLENHFEEYNAFGKVGGGDLKFLLLPAEACV